MNRFRNLVAVLGGTLLTLGLTALPALADYPPTGPKGENITRGPSAVTEDVAFTGRDITMLAVLVAVLVVAGVVALLAARRRAARAAA